jgi:hypothetical protein
MSFTKACSNKNPNDQLATAPAITCPIRLCNRRRRHVSSVRLIAPPAQQQMQTEELAAGAAATGSCNAASIGKNQKLNWCVNSKKNKQTRNKTCS